MNRNSKSAGVRLVVERGPFRGLRTRGLSAIMPFVVVEEGPKSSLIRIPSYVTFGQLQEFTEAAGATILSVQFYGGISP